MSYPHAETGGVKEGFTMARNRDYDDGDFDQPKRSSPYQDMDGDMPDFKKERPFHAQTVCKGPGPHQL